MSDLDRSSDQKKNGMVHNEILSMGANFRPISAPNHGKQFFKQNVFICMSMCLEEEVEDFSSMEIEDERCFTGKFSK